MNTVSLSLPSALSFHFQFCQHPQTSFLLRNLLKKGGENKYQPVRFLMARRRKLVLFLIKAQEEVIAWTKTGVELQEGLFEPISYQLFPTRHG